MLLAAVVEFKVKQGKQRGPGPSHLLLTPDHARNVVAVDPQKRTLTATVIDPRGGILAAEHFRVSGDGHRALEAWVLHFGVVARWGIEGSANCGRHTAIFWWPATGSVRSRTEAGCWFQSRQSCRTSSGSCAAGRATSASGTPRGCQFFRVS